MAGGFAIRTGVDILAVAPPDKEQLLSRVTNRDVVTLLRNGATVSIHRADKCIQIQAHDASF